MTEPSERDPLGGWREVFADWSAGRMIIAANDALDRLQGFGADLEPDNRLARAKALIDRCERLNVQLGVGDPAMERLLSEAYKTVFEIQLVLRGVHNPTPSEVKRLRHMLRGGDVPEESTHDPARDIQAEYLTAAMFWAAGYTVRLQEPDLVINRGPQTLGVAVKRIKSSRQFKRHMRTASGQLSRAKLTGFVVINPEVILSRAYYRDRTVDVSRLLFDKTLEWIQHIDYQHPKSPVFAVIGLATSFRWLPGGDGRRFHVLLHFHPRFVADEARGGMRAVHLAAEDLATAIKTSLRRLHQ